MSNCALFDWSNVSGFLRTHAFNNEVQLLARRSWGPDNFKEYFVITALTLIVATYLDLTLPSRLISRAAVRSWPCEQMISFSLMLCSKDETSLDFWSIDALLASDSLYTSCTSISSIPLKTASAAWKISSLIFPEFNRSFKTKLPRQESWCACARSETVCHTRTLYAFYSKSFVQADRWACGQRCHTLFASQEDPSQKSWFWQVYSQH